MRKVIIVGLFSAVLGVSDAGQAVEVCSYRVTATIGSPCPVSRGSQICLPESAAIGPCDSRLHCVGGPGYFCQAQVEPLRGPQRACPFGTLRPRGFRCHKPVTPGSIATATPSGTELPTQTPTATGIPTGTASATTTSTATPSLTATAAPTLTATAAATHTATATGVPTGTVAALVNGRIARRPNWR